VAAANYLKRLLLIQAGKTHAPLFDMRLWTAAMEAAVRMMWEMEELGTALGSAASTTKHVIVNRLGSGE
jgi:hypothetical protein